MFIKYNGISMTQTNNLLDTLGKATYFLSNKGLILLDSESSKGKSIRIIVGKHRHEVVLDKGICSDGSFYPSRFSCTCTRHATRGPSDIPCSHVLAALMKCREVYSKKV